MTAPEARAAGPYPVNLCTAGRVANLNCTANDVEVARITVLNNVTTCTAGLPVNLDLRAYLHVNAQDRHDIGLFLAKDGRSPALTVPSGGSADCAVYGLPQSPLPFANLDGNACGDFDRDGFPQGVEVPLELGSLTVTCKADAQGYLDIPTVVSWQQSGDPNLCQPPMAAWVEPGSPSKCEFGVAARIEVQVLGRIVVTKQTDPDASAGSFAYTATGPGVAPTAFSLSDGQSQTVTTGPLGPAEQIYVITEQQLGGWMPGAQIVCTDIDGDIAPFVTVDNANRIVTAHMTAAFNQAFCTFTNTRQASITINKATQGGDATFSFTGSGGIGTFPITTTGGAGQATFSALAPGVYTVAEAVPAGWDLTGLTCSDPTSDTTVNLGNATATINLAPGESVACTYTDTRRGSITVVKTAVGGNGSFNFTGPVSPASPAGTFQIATTGGTGQVVLAGLVPGVYNVSEIVPAGWDLTGVVCVDPSGGTTTNGTGATIGLAAGENVTCTFTDTRRGAIVVQKIALGADASFAFTGAQAFSITTTGGNGQNADAYASVPPGSYTVTESVPAGWALTGLACSNASPTSIAAATATVAVAAGELVTCTFTDTRLASLTIVKQAVPHVAAPNTPVFAFTATGLPQGSFSLSDDGTNPNSITFGGLLPGGAYQVTETPLANWPLTALSCSDQTDPNPANRTTINLPGGYAQPNLQAGEALSCVFTNARNDNGTISVTKSTVGGGGSFAFTNSGGVIGSATNPAAFTIVTTAPNPTGAQILSGLATGSYTITETTQSGWDLAPIACVVTSGSSTTFAYAPAGNAVTVNLGVTGGNVDAVACSFTNTRRGGITIVKSASPKDGQDFTFSATGGNGVPASFLLDDDSDPTLPNTAIFTLLPPGLYTFTEINPASWRLTDINCAGGTSVTTNPAAGLASINLQPGETVTCTYQNAKDGTITIAKTAVGGAGSETFPFAGPAPLAGAIGNGQALTGQFPAGTYVVSEQVPAGWDLSNIACTGGSVTITGAGVNPTAGFEPGDTTVGITIAPGQVVSCTFTDTRRGSITVVKQTIGGDGSFAYTGARSFAIQTTGGTGQDTAAFASVAPGSYVVTETVPAGWRLSGLTCSNASVTNLANATATVVVAPGESVSCTFTDTRLGTIRIVKVIHDDVTAAFNFTVPALLDPAGTFVLTPPVQATSAARTFPNVVPGIYAVAESPIPAGWMSLGVTCIDPTQDTTTNPGTASASIHVAAGETVECTFDNTRLSTITVTVISSGGTGTFDFTTTNLPAASFGLTTTGEGVPASRAFPGLPPGTYTVNGTGAYGWELHDLYCAADSGETYWTISGARASVTIPHGEDIECTYVYRLLPPPPPIPALSLWLLAVLGALLLGLGWRAQHRSGRQARPLLARRIQADSGGD